MNISKMWITFIIVKHYWHQNQLNRIDGVAVNVLVSSAVDRGIRFVLDKQTWLDFNIASLLKTKITGRYVAAPLGHIILNSSQPVSALSP
jgi:hypothetical protein